LHWSDDDGVSWPGANLGVTTNAYVGVPSCAAAGSDVWLGYGISMTPFMGTGNPYYAMRVAHLGSGGAAVLGDVNAAGLETSPLFYANQIVVRPSGALDLLFFAGASDGDTMASFRHSASTDVGVTWPASTPAYSPELFTMVRHRGPWLGDYVGMRVFGGALYTSYPVNEGPTMRSHVAFGILP
jgi:hypothetical protein